MRKWPLWGSLILALLAWLIGSPSAQAQTPVEWLTAVDTGQLGVNRLHGLEIPGALYVTLQVAATNPSQAELLLQVDAGNVLIPQDTAVCSVLLRGLAQPLQLPPGESQFRLEGYCLERELAPPGASVTYVPLTTAPASSLLQTILARAAAADLLDNYATQLAIWQTVEGVTLEELGQALAGQVANISRYQDTIAYLRGEQELVTPTAAAADTPTPLLTQESGGSEEPSPLPTGAAAAPVSDSPPGDGAAAASYWPYAAAAAVGLALLALFWNRAAFRPRAAAPGAASGGASRREGSDTFRQPADSVPSPQAAAQKFCVVCNQLTDHDASHHLKTRPDRQPLRASQSLPTEANVAGPLPPPQAARPAAASSSGSPQAAARSSGGSSQAAAGEFVPPRAAGMRGAPSFAGDAPSGRVGGPTEPVEYMASDSFVGTGSSRQPVAPVMPPPAPNLLYEIREASSDAVIATLDGNGGILARNDWAEHQLILTPEKFSARNRAAAQEISTPHALLATDNESVSLKDLHSSSGTFVNEKPIGGQGWIKLAHNDTVRFAAGDKYQYQPPWRQLRNLEGGQDIQLPANTSLLVTRAFVRSARIPGNPGLSDPHLFIRPGGEDRLEISVRDLHSRNGSHVLDGQQWIYLPDQPGGNHQTRRQLDIQVGKQRYRIRVQRQGLLDQVGPYEVKRPFDHIGVCDVYLVQDEQKAYYVAKVLNLERYASQGVQVQNDVKQAFQREMELLDRLNNPHLPRLVNSKQEEYLVMEFISPGCNLEMALRYLYRKERRLKFIEVRAVMDGLLDALEYLHGQGWVHCDVKPSNLVLHKYKGPGNKDEMRPYLVDLGNITQQQGKARFRTLYYSAPEVISGNAPVFPASDIYSAGCVLFTLLTNNQPSNLDLRTKPIDQWTEGAMRAETRGNLMELLNKEGPAYASVFGELISKCLERSPDDRYAHVAELRQNLDALCQSELCIAAFNEEGGSTLPDLIGEIEQEERLFEE